MVRLYHEVGNSSLDNLQEKHLQSAKEKSNSVSFRRVLAIYTDVKKISDKKSMDLSNGNKIDNKTDIRRTLELKNINMDRKNYNKVKDKFYQGNIQKIREGLLINKKDEVSR